MVLTQNTTNWIYIDTCLWCRPFDDQKDPCIYRETKAFHQLLTYTDRGQVKLIRSSLVHFELSFINDREKQAQIEKLMTVSGHFVIIPHQTKILAKKIQHECRLNGLDALHIACAIKQGIEIFLTSDDEILSKKECIRKFRIEVLNPIEYVRRKK